MELIKIEVKENGQKLVSARELYVKLGFNIEDGNFSRWINKQLENVDAIENVDFTRIVFKDGANNADVTDYSITMDIAKEICMIVGITPRVNEETRVLSKKFRRYFIDCEKKLTETYRSISENEKVNLELDIVERVSKMLNMNDSSKLICVTNILTNHNIPTNILPQYTESKGQLLPASDLLKNHNVDMSTIRFNKIMLERGLLVEKERQSTKGTKKFKSLTSKEWGENQISPKNPKETQPLYYADKFDILLNRLNIR